MRISILFALLTVFISGCGSPFRYVKGNETFQNSFIVFNAPSEKWEVTKKYDKKGYIDRFDGINMRSDVPGSTYHIRVESIDYWISPNLFDKNADYEAIFRDLVQYRKKRNEEQRITYSKDEVQYIQGMKCHGTVFSRNYGGSAYDATSKNYSITCGYYDTKELKNDGKRALRIEYRYQYANPDNTRLEKDKDLKASQIPSAQVIEEKLKQQVKQIIKTIKIKNFDMARMQQEGLIHKRKFKSTKW